MKALLKTAENLDDLKNLKRLQMAASGLGVLGAGLQGADAYKHHNISQKASGDLANTAKTDRNISMGVGGAMAGLGISGAKGALDTHKKIKDLESAQ